ncbi:hypothetical protein CYMTET_19292 [Cymbomonas tetramitiformis]|uniref:Uncharacterized protein n=1 Tax=Cymbomonas tetramitiformis TaxID=36881 RepID=A0AAE0L5C1_9CHLO|nr:hypothetical protein CYMTET_19292 [Cymbomonas tetramitiformis]
MTLLSNALSKASSRVIARSIGEATRLGRSVEVLELTSSADLVCANMMCEKLGEPCICRLHRVLERTPNVTTLLLAKNKLSQIPSSVWSLEKLEVLDLSDNYLTEMPHEMAQLGNLQTLNVSRNRLEGLGDWRQRLNNVQIIQ